MGYCMPIDRNTGVSRSPQPSQDYLGLCSTHFFGDQERNLRRRKVYGVHDNDIVGAMDLCILDQTYFEERNPA
jgi:hypothetical protein